MILFDSYYWEDYLEKAGEIDEWVHDAWMELIADDEYNTLVQFFDKDNYPHYDAFDESNSSETP